MKGIITGNIIEDDAKKELKGIEELINSTILDKSFYYIERILDVKDSVTLRLPK